MSLPWRIVTTIFEQALALFRFADWNLEPVEGATAASVTYRSGSRQWVFAIVTNESARTLTAFARPPIACPPERQPAMIDFFNRVNFAAGNGAWVLDPSDGEIRFRVGVDLEGRELGGDELGAVSNYVNSAMAATYQLLDDLVDGVATPESALASLFEND